MRQWRRQRTVRIVHVAQGQVAAVAEDVVPADAVVADADLAEADVADHAAAAAIVAAAAAVAVIKAAIGFKMKKAQSKDCAFVFVSLRFAKTNLSG